MFSSSPTPSLERPPLVVEHHYLTRAGVAVPVIPTPNMSGALRDPVGIILHDTAGPSLRSATNWLIQPKAKASAHVVVDLDGSPVQMVPFDRVAWHAGVSSYEGKADCNKRFIGIEIVNPGKLDRDGRAWFHKPTEKGYAGAVHMATREHGDGWWLPYPPEQVDSVIEMCRALVAAYPSIEVITTHWFVSPGRKVDTNPLFPLDAVRAEVFSPGPPAFLAMSGPVGEGPQEEGEEEQSEPEAPRPEPENVPEPALAPPPAPAVASAPKPGIVRTVRSSKSLMGIMVAAALNVVEAFTTWLHDAWDLIAWAVGLLPEMTADVKTTLTSSEEVASWLKIDWGSVVKWVTIAAIVVFFVRHLQDKRELEAKRRVEQLSPLDAAE